MGVYRIGVDRRAAYQDPETLINLLRRAGERDLLVPAVTVPFNRRDGQRPQDAMELMDARPLLRRPPEQENDRHILASSGRHPRQNDQPNEQPQRPHDPPPPQPGRPDRAHSVARVLETALASVQENGNDTENRILQPPWPRPQ